MVYFHSRRWEKAQEIEKSYWQKEYFRDSEFKELLSKYDELLSHIERKYQFSEDTKILDLGCGATCPSILFEKGERYGVDPLVDIFLEKDREKLLGKIRLSKGSGEEIPFEDSFFDVVLCRNALDHVDNVFRVMDEIRRVTRKQGIIILSIYTYTSFVALLKRTSEYVSYLRNIEHPHTFTPSKFRNVCAQYFEILEDKIVFEGKSSIDYGKQDVELKEPLSHKIVAGLNRYVFMNDWFLREYLVICRREV